MTKEEKRQTKSFIKLLKKDYGETIKKHAKV